MPITKSQAEKMLVLIPSIRSKSQNLVEEGRLPAYYPS